ncbi:DUF262 domain-containing protein [Clostridium perfringens]|uniref:DUF262 domain-containing protein n=1 Tax=Clostridium perfringens TaxID=1502 RepID=UPI003F4397AE
MRYLNRDSNNMTIAAFYELHMLNKFNYNPPYQRKSVWGEGEKSFLIDSLMKNFPIPPIFLYRKIDSETGKECYEVIDGKQRLMSIVGFIDNKISLPDDFGDGVFGDSELNGKYFKDLKEHKSIFWKYKLTIEYIESNDEKVINSVFDRLNRNGVKLNPQELRKAKYNETKLYNFILELKNHSFWKYALKEGVNSERLEDDEFVSDILFYIINNRMLTTNKNNLDKWYDKYKNINDDFRDKLSNEFNNASDLLYNLNIDIIDYKIYGVSHLYTLWNLVVYCINNSVDIVSLKDKLNSFYKIFRSNDTNEYIEMYKEGMARDVKSKTRRELRFKALVGYLNI